jgi:hypothetical protein
VELVRFCFAGMFLLAAVQKRFLASTYISFSLESRKILTGGIYKDKIFYRIDQGHQSQFLVKFLKTADVTLVPHF